MKVRENSQTTILNPLVVLTVVRYWIALFYLNGQPN